MRAMNPLERKIKVTQFTMEYLRGNAFNQPPPVGKAFIHAADVLAEKLLRLKTQPPSIEFLRAYQRPNAIYNQ
jgi:hypothetical protein